MKGFLFYQDEGARLLVPWDVYHSTRSSAWVRRSEALKRFLRPKFNRTATHGTTDGFLFPTASKFISMMHFRAEYALTSIAFMKAFPLLFRHRRWSIAIATSLRF